MQLQEDESNDWGVDFDILTPGTQDTVKRAISFYFSELVLQTIIAYSCLRGLIKWKPIHNTELAAVFSCPLTACLRLSLWTAGQQTITNGPCTNNVIGEGSGRKGWPKKDQRRGGCVTKSAYRPGHLQVKRGNYQLQITWSCITQNTLPVICLVLSLRLL